METWGFESRRNEMPGERFGLLFDLSGDFRTHEETLTNAGVNVDNLEKAKDKDDLLKKIEAAKKALTNKLDKEEDAEKIAKLEAALYELEELEGRVERKRADKGEAERPGRGGRRVGTASAGDDEHTKSPDEKLMEDEEYFKKYKQAKMRELDRKMGQMNTQQVTEQLGVAGTAFGMFNAAGGGGPFMSTASVGPGGSSFGVASGGGGFGHFGMAPFGAPGMVGIASPGGGSGAMGPGDVLFNIGAPMMTSGAAGLGEDIRRQNAKLEALINFLIMQILAGNTDAITTAMIAISRKSKGTLILSSVGMLSAMKQYDQQQAKISQTFQNLQFDAGNPDSMANFQHQSQNLSMQLNSIAVARQMLMNQMRDVLTMTEEIGNVEKSVLDIVGQFKRHYSRFNV